MSDIFISYKREDQPAARALAAALEQLGWTVWWDPKLRAGEHFDVAIEQALREARCVVVLWSGRSVTSQYVRDEATYALNRRKLVPVAIEPVDLPFRFEGLHTARLDGWNGTGDSPEFRTLLRDLSAILGPPPVPPSQPAPPTGGEPHAPAVVDELLPPGAAPEPALSPAPPAPAFAGAAVARPEEPAAEGDWTGRFELGLLLAHWIMFGLPFAGITVHLGGTGFLFVGMGALYLATRRHGALGWFWRAAVFVNVAAGFGSMIGVAGETLLFLAISYYFAAPPVGLWLRWKGRRTARRPVAAGAGTA